VFVVAELGAGGDDGCSLQARRADLRGQYWEESDKTGLTRGYSNVMAFARVREFARVRWGDAASRWGWLSAEAVSVRFEMPEYVRGMMDDRGAGSFWHRGRLVLGMPVRGSVSGCDPLVAGLGCLALEGARQAGIGAEALE